MSPEFPYQLVAFFDKSPEIGEGVYQGEKGWYPQLTVKRRFTYVDAIEDMVIEKIREFFATIKPITVVTGGLEQPERMPVRVLPIINSDELKDLHLKFIAHMGEKMHSRFPERDGENYMPHITAEYGGKFVIDVGEYSHATFTITSVCLIKDRDDGDSQVVTFIPIGMNK